MCLSSIGEICLGQNSGSADDAFREKGDALSVVHKYYMTYKLHTLNFVKNYESKGSVLTKYEYDCIIRAYQ